MYANSPGVDFILSTADVAAKRYGSRVDSGLMLVLAAPWTTPGAPFGGTQNPDYGSEPLSRGPQECASKELVRVASVGGLD